MDAAEVVGVVVIQLEVSRIQPLNPLVLSVSTLPPPCLLLQLGWRRLRKASLDDWPAAGSSLT